ncbi:gamma-butyrobetaine dioxygenase-like [Babylonia areolata]|uniref:gamma-butyrobetaine dioxygenase-like n=1 Tax=Babylonia areolata TaxID=304850 RepID=UPI003FD02E8F
MRESKRLAMHRSNVFTTLKRLLTTGHGRVPPSPIVRSFSVILAAPPSTLSFSSPSSSSSSLASSSTASSRFSSTANEKDTRCTDIGQGIRPPSQLSIATDRGAYDSRTIPHVTGYDVKSLTLVEEGKHVQVTWDDGRVSRYHSLWLRHVCFCPACKFEVSGQPNMAYDQIASDLKLASVMDDGEGCLVAQWKGEDSHTGVFPLKFLKFHCYSSQSMAQRREAIRMLFTTDTTIPEVMYEEVMESDEGLLQWLTALNERGICLVKGLPTEPGMGRKVVERISRSVLPTIYGYVDEIKCSPEPINAGYSSDELDLHQDLVYYSSPPGLQAVFCLRFDSNIEGGESVFADMFHVAETFREQHPEDFNVLATVPATLDTIHYQRDWPVHMNVKIPMFTLNDCGDLVGVRYQPHHMGPLHVSEELIEPFYAAFKKFYTLTKNWPYKFYHRLQPGDLISYNNRRFAHGRTAFTYQSGQVRHFQNCYLNVSELKSCMQTLSNLVGDGHVIKRIGDHDYM